MICHVVINDFETGQRIRYVLDDSDFKIQEDCWDHTDDVLIALQHTDMFRDKLHWCDLDIQHFHVMIVNLIRIIGDMPEETRSDKTSAPVMRLAFFLCGLIVLLQRNGSVVDFLRLNRVSPDDVVYDYTASLSVVVDRPPPRGLKVIIDNEDE
jgi:hypothetical protein